MGKGQVIEENRGKVGLEMNGLLPGEIRPSLQFTGQKFVFTLFRKVYLEHYTIHIVFHITMSKTINQNDIKHHDGGKILTTFNNACHKTLTLFVLGPP